MEFNGTFEITDSGIDEVWDGLSDPAVIERALPGCVFLVEVDDDAEVNFRELADRESDGEPDDADRPSFEEGKSYAALVQVNVGAVTPRFETVVTIDKREFPEMEASGEGKSGSSSFEMASGMTLTETDTGVTVDWWSSADVFGRIAQMGQRLLNPAANKIVQRFFTQIQTEIARENERSDDSQVESRTTEADEQSTAEADGGLTGRFQSFVSRDGK
ncbi:CoxG family protein [Halomarina halobia]|uniref:CoxG family protein n=1 Tax=Halomarina halobia TaxID=3033386 RepID=A0ABD6AEM4_9EURY|nr:SRPBCC domain-containing protein [Halomarina sp. PSR21]